MGVDVVAFQSAGQRTEHYIPGAYSRPNYVRSAGGGVSAGNAVFIGESNGGKPYYLEVFYTAGEAREVLKGGPLLEAVLVAFQMGGEYAPQKIMAMRVNPGTQATRILRSSGTDIITVKTQAYGLHANQLKMKLEAGTTGKKLTVQSGTNPAVVKDDILRPSFEVQYGGTGSAATMAITKTGLTTTATGATADNLAIDFASFPTIGELVAYIDAHEKYTCVIKTADSQEKCIQLDAVAAQDIKTAAYTASSNLQAVIDALGKFSEIESASFIDAAPTRVMPDVDTIWAYFSGGTHGACTVSEYAAALLALESEDVNILGTPATDEATHILIRNHCVAMSSVEGRKERTFIVGGPVGETVAQAIARAKNLATDTGSLAYPGFEAYDVLVPSVKKTFPPAMYAALLIGQESALAINEPMTNKSAGILAWESNLSKGDLVKLIQAGVTAGGKSQDNRLATIRSLTTHQGNELQRCERSMKRESNYMMRDLREAISKSVGTAGSDGMGVSEEAIFWTKVAAWHREGLIIRTPGGKLAWGFTLTRSGSATYIEYNAFLTAPKNFFFITGNHHVYDGSSEQLAL